MILNLDIKDYTYDLPPERIALHPLQARDQSKLLIYNKGIISHEHFNALPDSIPTNSLLVFNNTKVIPARILFQKDTGAEIEVFLLTPVSPSVHLAEVMQASGACTWKCTIGNLKRWTPGVKLKKQTQDIVLEATLLNHEEGLVEFNWPAEKTFADIVDISGKTPLPPYLKRETNDLDKTRYQTIYSHYEGAVAAPTAGLHFTEAIFNSLQHKGVEKDFVTLHVSAGTFKPVKVDNAIEHTMHQEQLIVTRKNIENLLRVNQFVIPVGITSMRTLESLYWYGVKLLNSNDTAFSVSQTYPYEQHHYIPSREESLKAVLKFFDSENIESITGHSSIYIYPGYSFKICNALITNFHQPGSTLILLVAALAGEKWKTIYHEALENNYRFLSFGDSSLIIP